MYSKKTTGYVISTHNDGVYLYKKASDYWSHRVVKAGQVLNANEEMASLIHKNTDIASIARKGFIYYQVISNQGACEKCEGHEGAIYPVRDAQASGNLPPFHPNCKCAIQGF
ncbi:phage minor head protein [Oscillospiraceae bacterium MB08-C2-2]|nr:phage minor head protein [Oscillospiraceae bacterium MB08-C2-2]